MKTFFSKIKANDSFAENLLKKWVNMEFKNPALVWVAMNRGRGLTAAGAMANQRREGVKQQLKEKGAKYLSSGVYLIERDCIPSDVLEKKDKMIEVGGATQIIPRAITGFSFA